MPQSNQRYSLSGSKGHALLLSVLFVLSFSACSNDIEKVRFFDQKSLPAQTIKEASMHHSTSGKVQMVMSTPLVQKYITPDKRTIYPEGLHVNFLNPDGSNRAYLWALRAEELTDNNMVQAHDSVVIIDYENGDTVYLKNLTWNRGEGRMYSNELIRAVNGQRLTYGDGFESDDQFTNPQIFHQRGTIEWSETQDEQQD